LVGLGRFTRMKIFLWLVTVALILTCLTGWVMSEFVARSMKETMKAVPCLYFTGLVIFPHGWLLMVPVPWVVYAGVLTVRRELTPAAVFLFTGVLIFCATLLVCALVIALTLPYIPRIP
jgi:hypothetical protein